MLNISNSLFQVISFIVGACLGSFYNVCIHRYLSGESIVYPPSHCPRCGHRLSWKENIPIISFFLLRGKCAHCRENISTLYPVVEILSSLWAWALAYKFGTSIFFLIYLFFGGLFIIMSFIDILSYTLPDILTIPGTLIAFISSHFLGLSPWDSLLGALAGGGIFLLIQQLYKRIRGMEGMGGGDIKLMFLIGALLGIYSIPFVVFFGALSGLMASVFYLKKDNSQGMATQIPFGPFLCLAAMVFILFKDTILKFYI